MIATFVEFTLRAARNRIVDEVPTVGFRALPREEEIASLGDDDLFDIVNLTKEDTGIDGVIFISTAVGAHGPRVKYYLKTRKDQPSFSVSISDHPRLLATSLPDRVVKREAPRVIDWVKKTRLTFWLSGTTEVSGRRAGVEQFLARLRSRPATTD